MKLIFTPLNFSLNSLYNGTKLVGFVKKNMKSAGLPSIGLLTEYYCIYFFINFWEGGNFFCDSDKFCLSLRVCFWL